MDSRHVFGSVFHHATPDGFPVASTPCRYPPRLPASPSLPASATLAPVHVPAEAWNATGAILRGRHGNPAIGIHKADDLDAGGKSTRQAIG